MKHKKKEREARREDARRRADDRATVRAETTGKGLSRLTSFIGNWVSMVFSNLRFSLTLRIALHSSAQLLRTTLLVIFAFTVVFGIAQLPTIDATIDAISAQVPGDGLTYTAEQLVGLPVNGAYLLEEPIPDTFSGFWQGVKIAAEGVQSD